MHGFLISVSFFVTTSLAMLQSVSTASITGSTNQLVKDSTSEVDIVKTAASSTCSKTSLNTDDKKPSYLAGLAKHKTVACLCLMVAFGGFVFGWDTGTISGFVQMPNFKATFGEFDVYTSSFEFSNARVGLIISIFNIGCAIGGITLSKLGDLYGRKLGLMIVMLVYIIGIAIQIASFQWFQFMIGRIVSGLAVGAVSVLSPLFIAETSPSDIRGVTVCCYQLMITLGIVLGYCTTYGTVHNFVDSSQWRIPLGLCFLWALFMISGMVFLPESSRYLLKKNKFDEAKQSIAKTNNWNVEDILVQTEMDLIHQSILEENAAGEATWSELFTGKPHIFIRLIIGISLQSFQQLTGNNYFFYYGTSIFKSVGLQDSFITSIILGTVNFCSTLVALYTIDRFGRRKILIGGSIFMALCLFVFSIIGSISLYPNGYSQASDQKSGYAMILFTCLFIFFFAVTWAPGVFVVVSETYPLRIRSKGMAIATAANWIWGFLIAFFTPLITNSIRFSYGFVFFGCTVSAALFVYFMVPETSGLTLEKVNILYESYKPLDAVNTLDKAFLVEKADDGVISEV